MMIILLGVVALWALIFLGKNGSEKLRTGVLSATISLLFLTAFYLSYFGEQYEDYSESYPLRQMNNGCYYNTSGDKISVMILDGDMQKPKTFAAEKVSFVNENIASVKIQGERVVNSKALEVLFFYESNEKDTVKNVIISVPGNSLEKPLTGNFCTSCWATIKENDNFYSSCGQKIKSE